MKCVLKVFAAYLLTVAVILSLAGCGEPVKGPTLNGKSVSDYTIVYSENSPSYNQRAAEYIQSQIQERTGIALEIRTAEAGKNKREILVGETGRKLSKKLDAETQNVEFAMLADKNHIAIEGDYYIIAAAAYYFVQTYITGSDFDSVIPQEVSIYSPITEKANNYIFLIGDGMGQNHTQMFGNFDMERTYQQNDGETQFYGNYLPYRGQVRTKSVSGVTDSAAAATALATGYQTANGRIGRDPQGNDLMSLTELANSLGMATAVMSTDGPAGATPAAFSAHADDREDTNIIIESQKLLKEAGTLVVCNLDSKRNVREPITDTLQKLEQSEKGFFVMYEEGHIDKHSHNKDVNHTFEAMLRFNQAIGTFMEYAFYHPDTMLLITADHETGGMKIGSDGWPLYTTDIHTDANVPIFAYGQGAEEFHEFDRYNVAVARHIAKLWGEENFGSQ